MLKLLRETTRFLKILYLLVHYKVDVVLGSYFDAKFLRALKFVGWWRTPVSDEGEQLRQACEALGPLFIKFGQLVSTRRDLVSPSLALGLAKLQDHVTPFDSQLFVQLLEKIYKKPLQEVFKSVSMEPLGSASIAQVHEAITFNDESVVIKVLRPDIHHLVRQDIQVMESIARWVERLVPGTRRFKPVEVVKEFKKTTEQELDLMNEAANASHLRRNFLNSPMIYVPKIYWEYTHSNALVMEKIQGVPVSDIQALKNAKVDLKKLAERGVEIFFTQVFRDRFFHADMHPGNVFVNIDNPQDPKYIAIDFGIMGSLNEEDQRYLAQNFLAFFEQDYQRVAQLHINSGWVPANTPLNDFESAIRSVCEPIFGKSIQEISFGQTLLRLFQTARAFNMPVQPQLILLQKTLLMVEGLGRELYPQLDLWTTAKPYLKQWMRQRVKPSTLFKQMKYYGPVLLEELPLLPLKINQALEASQKLLQQQTQQKASLSLSQAIVVSTLCIITASLIAILPMDKLHPGHFVAALSAIGILLTLRNDPS